MHHVSEGNMRTNPLDRRQFLIAGGAATAATLIAAPTNQLLAAEPGEKKLYPLKRAVKFSMIKIKGSIEDKFALIKRIGFQGVEMDSPNNLDRDEVLRARDKTGIDIHGVVDSIHWQVRLSDPDPAVREKGLEGLKTALRDCRHYGGTTVLLVPGKVSDPEIENFDQVWERSTAQVRKAIPLADELGVKIAIEVVWNDFITKPEQLVEYVDQFKTPTVGAYFDSSNMLKYGVPSAEWIRRLGKRMLKFDLKGFDGRKFDRKENPWVAIGEGTEDWPSILKALDELDYHDWATAEVAGGGERKLKDIYERMDRIFTMPG